MHCVELQQHTVMLSTVSRTVLSYNMMWPHLRVSLKVRVCRLRHQLHRDSAPKAATL
jgi:hypothetical protein